MFQKRGQLALESLFLWGALLVFLVAVLFVSTELLGFNYKVSQIQDSVDMLALTANTVHTLGEGSKDTVRIYVPNGISGASVTGNAIAVGFSLGGQSTEITANTKFDLLGQFPVTNGYHNVPVYAVDGRTVLIGNGLYLKRLIPTTVEFNELPINLELYGANFDPLATVLVDDVPYNANFVTFVDSGKIIVRAVPGFFPPEPGGKTYQFSVQNPDGQKSNKRPFIVTPAGNPQGS